MATHSITAVKLGETVIDGIVDSRVSPGVELFIAGADGHPYNSKVYPSEIRPTASFTTLKVAAAIAELGIDGLAITSTPLHIYTVDNAAGGARENTGEKITVNKGLIVPTRLSNGQGRGQWSTLSYDVYMGGTVDDAAPMTLTSDQVPPTRSPISELFKLGPCTLNSADITGIVRSEIDFGFAVQQVMSDGKLYPVQVYWMVQQPMITIDSITQDVFATVTFPGTENLITLQCLKVGAGSGHKTFSTHANYVHVERFGGDHGGRVETSIGVVPVWDGTNAPVTVA